MYGLYERGTERERDSERESRGRGSGHSLQPTLPLQRKLSGIENVSSFQHPWVYFTYIRRTIGASLALGFFKKGLFWHRMAVSPKWPKSIFSVCAHSTNHIIVYGVIFAQIFELFSKWGIIFD